MLPCSRCSLGFESCCEQTGSCLRVLPFITGTSFLQALPSAVSSAPFPPLFYQSVVPALEDGYAPYLSPVLSMQFHVTPLVQVRSSLLPHSTFHPSHPLHPNQVSLLDGASPDCLSEVAVPPSALLQHCRSHPEFTHLLSGPVFSSLESLLSLRNPWITLCLFSPSAKLKQIVSIC